MGGMRGGFWGPGLPHLSLTAKSGGDKGKLLRRWYQSIWIRGEVSDRVSCVVIGAKAILLHAIEWALVGVYTMGDDPNIT